jgi:hypothetical protein
LDLRLYQLKRPETRQHGDKPDKPDKNALGHGIARNTQPIKGYHGAGMKIISIPAQNSYFLQQCFDILFLTISIDFPTFKQVEQVPLLRILEEGIMTWTIIVVTYASPGVIKKTKTQRYVSARNHMWAD